MPHKTHNAQAVEPENDVSREDIVSAFRNAMVGHFRSHIPGTNINESTLLASDYLNHFHELVMLIEALATEPKECPPDFRAWRPLTYEEHFSQSGFRDKNLAIAAYRRAPRDVRARFDEAVAKLHREALSLTAFVGRQLDAGQTLELACQDAVGRLRVLIEEANAIANGEPPAKSGESAANGEPTANDEKNGQGAVDALFGNDFGRFDP